MMWEAIKICGIFMGAITVIAIAMAGIDWLIVKLIGE